MIFSNARQDWGKVIFIWPVFSLKISHSSLCIAVKRAPEKADLVIGRMMCLSNYYMQPWLLMRHMTLSVVVDSNDSFWAHSTMSVSGFATKSMSLIGNASALSRRGLSLHTVQSMCMIYIYIFKSSGLKHPHCSWHSYWVKLFRLFCTVVQLWPQG